jgi:hypothetical protein
MTEAECIQRVRDLTVGVNHHHFQQWPEELGKAIHRLLPQKGAIRNYLEIGAGAGHVARVWDTFFEFSEIALIDNGKLYSGRLEQALRAREWIGDSTSPLAITALAEWDLRFDLVFIDADHSYESVKADTELAAAYAAESCYFVFHDTERDGVSRWLHQLNADNSPWRQRLQRLYQWVHRPGNRGTAIYHGEFS